MAYLTTRMALMMRWDFPAPTTSTLDGVVAAAQSGQRDVRGDPALAGGFVQPFADGDRHLQRLSCPIEEPPAAGLGVASTGSSSRTRSVLLNRKSAAGNEAIAGRGSAPEEERLHARRCRSRPVACPREGMAPPSVGDEARADAELARRSGRERHRREERALAWLQGHLGRRRRRAGGGVDVGRSSLREVVRPSGLRLQLARDPERGLAAGAGHGVDAEARVGPDAPQPVDRRVDGARRLGNRRVGGAACRR